MYRFPILILCHLQIRIAPTGHMMRIGVKNYDWHELFPRAHINFSPQHEQQKSLLF
ncbi:hypothetical protein ACS0TY_034190 [Phlomoides rotata]